MTTFKFRQFVAPAPWGFEEWEIYDDAGENIENAGINVIAGDEQIIATLPDGLINEATLMAEAMEMYDFIKWVAEIKETSIATTTNDLIEQFSDFVGDAQRIITKVESWHLERVHELEQEAAKNYRRKK